MCIGLSLGRFPWGLTNLQSFESPTLALTPQRLRPSLSILSAFLLTSPTAIWILLAFI